MSHQNNAQHQKTYRTNLKEMGVKQITIWILPEDREYIRPFEAKAKRFIAQQRAKKS